MTSPTPKRRPGRPRGQPSHIPKLVNARAHPAIRQLTDLQIGRQLTDSEMARLAGWPADMPRWWRSTKRYPRLQVLSDFAEVFGYEVKLVPKGQKP